MGGVRVAATSEQRIVTRMHRVIDPSTSSSAAGPTVACDGAVHCRAAGLERDRGHFTTRGAAMWEPPGRVRDSTSAPGLQ